MENHDKEPLTSNYPQHPVLKWLSYRGTPPSPTVCRIHRKLTIKGVERGVGPKPSGARRESHDSLTGCRLASPSAPRAARFARTRRVATRSLGRRLVSPSSRHALPGFAGSEGVPGVGPARPALLLLLLFRALSRARAGRGLSTTSSLLRLLLLLRAATLCRVSTI